MVHPSLVNGIRARRKASIARPTAAVNLTARGLLPQVLSAAGSAGAAQAEVVFDAVAARTVRGLAVGSLP
jgi:hypothetical protein